MRDAPGLLARAGEGSAGAAEVTSALETYWERHSGTLHATAAVILEQVRGQVLQALHGWRDQLATGVDARRKGHEHPR